MPIPRPYALLAVALLTPLALDAQTITFAGRTLRTNIGAGVGAPVLDGARLRMMDGEYGTARSALSTGTVDLRGAWATTFRLTYSCVGVEPNPDEPICPGDGIGFVATGGADSQVGGGGFDLGYGGSFAESITFGMKTFWNFADFGADGAWDRGCCGNPPLIGPGETFEDDFDVALAYDGSATLTGSIRRVSNGQLLFSDSRSWLAPAWAANARVGFTAGSGIASEFSWVGDWTLRTTTVVPEPGPLALLALGAGLLPVIARSRRRR